LSVLLTSGKRFTEATANRCFTCHQQSQPSLAFSLAASKNVPFDDAVWAEQIKQTLTRAKAQESSAVEQPHPVPSIPAWLLIGLHAAGTPPSATTDRYVYSLARSQHKDGRWITRASRAPTDYTDVTSTALALRALDLYSPPSMRADIRQRMAAAAAWLREFPALTAEERAYQLLGLHWAGAKREQMAEMSNAFIAEQRADGGWAQLPTLESDAYATGLALHSLTSAGAISPAHAVFQRGMDFLLKEQLPDGSWFVRTRASPVQVAVHDIFPHGEHQWISSVATTWAAMALLSAIHTSELPSQ
jgi:hypothetical protein